MARDSVAPGRGKVALLGLLVATAAFLTFLPTVDNGFVNYDDDTYVSGNPHLRHGLSPTSIAWAACSGYASNWHPLTWLSHLVDWQLYGARPWGHHLTSVLIHSLSTALIFVLLQGLTRSTWRSLAVAVFFGVHPLHVQSVAWASERKDVLSALFFLLTVWAYARRARVPAQGGRRALLHYWVALVFFAMGLMSKPMLVTLPAVLLLLDYWPLQRWQSGRVPMLLVEKLPFLLLSAISCVVTFVVQRAGGGMADLQRLSIVARVQNVPASYIRYLGKTLWPADLAVLYPFGPGWPWWAVVASSISVLGISLAALRMRRRPYLPVGWFWFVGMLVPVIGIVQVGQQSMADRYMYLPSLGLFILAVWGLADLCAGRRPLVRGLAAAGVVAAVACVLVTRGEIGHWKDSEALFRREIAVAGDTATAHYKLGLALNEKGILDEAYQHFGKSLALAPGSVQAFAALGVVCNRRGQTDEAIAWLEAALKQDPDVAQSRYQLGIALDRKGRPDDALAQYDRALRIDPALVDAHLGAGAALGRQGKYAEAIRRFQAALAIEPGNAPAYYNLGLAYSSNGQWDEAQTAFDRSISLTPGNADAHNNLGLVLLRQGRRSEAMGEFQEALRLDPDHQRARSNLEVAAQLGKAAAAESAPR